ncbi:hypothetical protein LZG00_08885 [Rhodobacteraceae bacterium LMO-12]|nr:hypothetical protein [Rhodobacteraceae bacterium LMO-JJ12]
MALAFDKGAAFAIDKPAAVPCPNLARHSCTIHDTLSDKGFAGCVAYECTGAGQRTVALYHGQSWQDDPALLGPQIESFAHLRILHGRIELLLAAAILPLPPAIKARRASLLARLCPDEMTPRIAHALATGPIPSEVDRFLKTLARYTPVNPPRLKPA